jgi:SAM-dependent methyltransferase
MPPDDDFPSIDTKTASVARLYDYMLGGTDNYEADRRAAEALEDMFPGTWAGARNNRRYLERAVRYLAGECGIRQFIDHGTGLPTQNNVHQVAQAVAPGARVIYVDNDPVVLAHGRVRALVAEDHSTAYIHEDARNAGAILAHPDTRRIIDFSQPVAVMYISFLHCIPDADDPWGLVRRMMDRTAPGSYLVISHGVSDDPEVRRTVTETLVAATGGNWGRLRERDEVRTFFDGLDPVDPGLVDVTAWHPDGGEEEQTEAGTEFGGVARKP